MRKNIITILIILIFTIGLSSVQAHGVDVTNDKMVIADESNGQEIKDIADSNNINISVYKFTSEDEVEHQLEHMLNNSNKYIIVVAYQDTANKFLEKHDEVKDRLIIMDEYDENSLKDNMEKILNQEQNETNNSNENALIVSCVILVIIILVGAVLVIKNKKK